MTIWAILNDTTIFREGLRYPPTPEQLKEDPHHEGNVFHPAASFYVDRLVNYHQESAHAGLIEFIRVALSARESVEDEKVEQVRRFSL